MARPGQPRVSMGKAELRAGSTARQLASGDHIGTNRIQESILQIRNRTRTSPPTTRTMTCINLDADGEGPPLACNRCRS